MLLLECVGEHVQGVVMRSDADDGVRDFVPGAEELHAHRVTGGNPLVPCRDADHAVGAHQGHEHARAPRHRCSNEVARDAADFDAQKLFNSERRCDLAAELRRQRFRRRIGPPCMAWRRGLTKRLKVSAAETGYPGMPMTGLPCTIPRITGLPGLMFTPWTIT